MASQNAGDGGGSGATSGALVPIIVALITVSGVIATALFANWDKIFGRPAIAAPSQQQSADGSSAAPATSAAPAEKEPATQPVTAGPAAAAPPQASAPAQPSAAGIWRDEEGYSFDVRQQGHAITYQQYLNGTLVGTGGGEIQGLEMRYTYLGTQDRGTCVARLAPEGNEIAGRCQSITGQVWRFAVTR